MALASPRASTWLSPTSPISSLFKSMLNCTRCSTPLPSFNPSNADLASALTAIDNFPPVSSLLPSVPPLASASACLTPWRTCSSSVKGAFTDSLASCRSHPSFVNSFSSVAKICSQNRSAPSSRTSVSRVDANSIFCRTGAASGT